MATEKEIQLYSDVATLKANSDNNKESINRIENKLDKGFDKIDKNFDEIKAEFKTIINEIKDVNNDLSSIKTELKLNSITKNNKLLYYVLFHQDH